MTLTFISLKLDPVFISFSHAPSVTLRPINAGLVLSSGFERNFLRNSSNLGSRCRVMVDDALISCLSAKD